MVTKVFCNFITPKIKALAKELGISESYTETLVSVWQTENNSVSDPKAQDIKTLIERGKKNNEDYFLAVPNYEGKDKPHNPALPMLSMTSTGKIVINKLPNEKPMDYFFSQLEKDNAKYPNKHNIDTIKKYVASPLEAYQYLLWRAQVRRQFNLKDSSSQTAFDTINEVVESKIKKYRSLHPLSKEKAISEKDLAVLTPTNSQPITYVSKSELNGALALTDKNNNIKIANDFTYAEFFRYIKGQMHSETSEQKQKVFEILNEKGYTEDELIKLVTNVRDAQTLLMYHELSHVAHNDRANYWEPEIDGEKLEHKNYLTPHKIEIETRATQEAWNKLRQDKDSFK